ncbi:MAG TPA: hypothetical protein VGJ50_25935 [Streptosporangiaceae bacterium]
MPDTGSLRDDLLALLTAISKARATFTAVAAAAGFSGRRASCRSSTSCFCRWPRPLRWMRVHAGTRNGC